MKLVGFFLRPALRHSVGGCGSRACNGCCCFSRRGTDKQLEPTELLARGRRTRQYCTVPPRREVIHQQRLNRLGAARWPSRSGSTAAISAVLISGDDEYLVGASRRSVPAQSHSQLGPKASSPPDERTSSTQATGWGAGEGRGRRGRRKRRRRSDFRRTETPACLSFGLLQRRAPGTGQKRGARRGPGARAHSRE